MSLFNSIWYVHELHFDWMIALNLLTSKLKFCLLNSAFLGSVVVTCELGLQCTFLYFIDGLSYSLYRCPFGFFSNWKVVLLCFPIHGFHFLVGY